MKKEIKKFKVGDKVKCITGFYADKKDSDPLGGGFGYKVYMEFIIDSITSYSGHYILWSKTINSGVMSRAVKLVPESL